MSTERHDLVEPFDSDLGSARIDRGEWEVPDEASPPRKGGHPEDAERQLRPQPPDELVGAAGPGPGEPSDEHGSAGMDSGSMDPESLDPGDDEPESPDPEGKHPDGTAARDDPPRS